LVALLFVAVAPAGCGDRNYEIDSFPVAVELDAGVPIGLSHTPEVDDITRVVVLDTATPLTILDDGKAPGSDPTRRLVTFTLLSPTAGGAVPRARFPSVSSLLGPVGSVGLAGEEMAIEGILGADVLQRVAVRVNATNGDLHFFPDIAGNDDLHDTACDAVLATPLRGGGKYVAGNETVQFLASRLVVSACLAPENTPYTLAGDLDRGAPIARTSGRDALLVVATGVPITVITSSAYLALEGVTPFDDLPVSRLFLPGGDPAGDEVKLGEITRIALTARGDEENPRGSCMELAVSRLMERCGLTTLDVHPPECLADTECAAAGTAEIGQVRVPLDAMRPPDAVRVAIVADTHPLIQGLRAELRPDVGEIDGLLGMDALRSMEVDLDYPGERILLRCADPADARCLVRPRMGDLTRRRELSACWRERLPNDYLCSQ